LTKDFSFIILGLTSQLMFCAPQTIRETLDKVLVQEMLHNNVYQNDKLSEIVIDSDLDGSGYSAISDGNKCRVEYILIT
jgi:hypothetical protein